MIRTTRELINKTPKFDMCDAKEDLGYHFNTKWLKLSVLQDFVTKHKAKSMLTCPEDCLCWDLDLMLDGEFKDE